MTRIHSSDSGTFSPSSLVRGEPRRFDTDEHMVHSLLEALHRNEVMAQEEVHASLGVPYPVFQRYYMMPGCNNKPLCVGGAEALFRWRFGEEVIQPAYVFQVLQRFPEHLIALTKTMIEWSCWACAFWNVSDSPFAPSVSVNIPVTFLACHDAYETVVEILEKTGLLPYRLVLEITERGSGFSGLNRCASCIRDLIALGVSFAADDFGAGFSSTERGLCSSVSGVKMDGSFLRRAGSLTHKLAILKKIVRFFREYGKYVIIECVENKEQAEALFDEFCCWASVGVQGFHYHFPEEVL